MICEIDYLLIRNMIKQKGIYSLISLYWSSVRYNILPSTFTPYVREGSLNLLSNQSPVLTESDGSIEEVEISQLPSSAKHESVQNIADKEQEEDGNLEEE